MFIFRLLFQTVFLAFGQIWANKTRAALTALGIIIGVSAVIATVSATDGPRRRQTAPPRPWRARQRAVRCDGVRDLPEP